jgi:uncharacterized damage-inducible protein DinB
MEASSGAAAAGRDRIADELRRGWDGEPWHGDPLRAVLEGIGAGQAAARPLRGAHSIGELVLHVTAWTREVARRLRDRVAREPENGDWPVFGGGAEGWERARDSLAQAHAELFGALAAFPPEELDATVGQAPDRPLGTGVSYAAMLHGLAQHHAYHAGQIALLKKG